MTTTYDTLATEIADEIADTALTSQIQLCIAEARRKYDRRRFYFNVKTTTLSTVANQEYYSGAILADSNSVADIEAIDDVKILIDTATYPLNPMAFGMMDGLQTAAVIGDPIAYAYYGQRIRFYPIPGQVRTVTLAYLYKAAAPVFGSGVADIWTTEAYDLIRYATKRLLYSNYARGEEQEGIQAALEADALKDLMAETRQRISNGILRTDIPQRHTRFNIQAGW